MQKRIQFKFIAFVAGLLCYFISSAQKDPFIDSLLRTNLYPKFKKVIDRPLKYKLKIYYTKIDRDNNNLPHFTTYSYVPDYNKNYFYPASTVKLPVSLVAVAKLDALNASARITRETTMITDSAYFCQRRVSKDESSTNKLPSVGNYIKKMFLVSDNNACARTYEFVGCDYLHQVLERWNFPDVRLTNRLDGKCPGDSSKITPPVYFFNDKGDTLYKQALLFPIFTKKHPESKSVVGGKDFSNHNYFKLEDLHNMMRRLVFNNYLPQEEKLSVSEESRLFLLKYLGMYPRESDYPKYDPKIYYDSFKKYFMYGNAVTSIKGDSIRIYNIVGRAFGFLVDCAYIVDFKNKTEFLLTAGIYVNERNEIGSGKYEYDTIGMPFLKEFSKTIYGYELMRQKLYLPDLEEFNLFNYKPSLTSKGSE